MVSRMFSQKADRDLATLSRIFLLLIFLTPIFILVGYAESEQVILDLYTQKRGQGVNVQGGTFGLGEGVRLMVQLSVPLPQTVEEASKFFKTQVDFAVTDPEEGLLVSRSEHIDLNGLSIIAFMLPSNARAGTYKATATYKYQGQTATDFLNFRIDPGYSFEKITRSGRITHDETWSGTVHITGDLQIDDGIAVTIEPGTTVFFAAHSDDQHSGQGEEVEYECDPTPTAEYAQSHVEVWGTIIARGTEDSIVIFTSDSLSPSYADWRYLTLARGTILEYVIIEYGTCSGVEEHSGDTVQVSHCIARHFLACGIGVSAPATVTHNVIYDCGHEGIDVSPRSGTPIIANNIVFHSAVGIFAHASQIVEHNTLIDNDRGIALHGGYGVVRYNLITSPSGAPHDWTSCYKASAPHGHRERIRGIEVAPDELGQGASPTMTGNIIRDNPKNIEVFGNSSPAIKSNNIFNGEVGIWFNEFTGTTTVHGNNIYDNKFNVKLHKAPASIDAANNWWGTSAARKIKKKIRDYHDNRTLGKVNYEPLERQTVQCPSVISFSPMKSTIPIGETVTISGFVGPPHGGATITLTYTKPNTTAVSRTLITNVAGCFSDTYILDQTGSWRVRASWGGDEAYAEATAMTSFTVNMTPIEEEKSVMLPTT